MKKILFVLFIAFAFVLTNCSHELLNLSTAKKRVITYYESGQYDSELNKIFDDAKRQIEKVKLTKNSAVIFDVDETTLSNYEMIKRLSFGYEQKIWDGWLLNGNDKAIPESKGFYDWLVEKNIKIIFLTGRLPEVRDATIKNLRGQGYTDFDTLITRNKGDIKESAALFKEQERIKLAGKGYDLIACVGDQWSDMEGKYTGIKIKLPNYLYLVK